MTGTYQYSINRKVPVSQMALVMAGVLYSIQVQDTIDTRP